MKQSRGRTDSRHTASHRSHLGLHEWAAVLGILVDDVGRDIRILCDFLYTIHASRLSVTRRYIGCGQ